MDLALDFRNEPFDIDSFSKLLTALREASEKNESLTLVNIGAVSETKLLLDLIGSLLRLQLPEELLSPKQDIVLRAGKQVHLDDGTVLQVQSIKENPETKGYYLLKTVQPTS